MERRNWSQAKRNQAEARQWAERERLAKSAQESPDGVPPRVNSKMVSLLALLIVVLFLGTLLYINSTNTGMLLSGTEVTRSAGSDSQQGYSRGDISRRKLILRNESNSVDRRLAFVTYSSSPENMPEGKHHTVGVVRR